MSRAAVLIVPSSVRNMRTTWKKAALFFACGTLVAGTAGAQNRPPSSSHIKKLLREWVTLEGWTEAGAARQAEILEEIRRVDPLDRSRDAEKWRDEIFKAQMRYGRRLEDDSRQFWWEDESRGLLLVGGAERRPRGLIVSMHGGGVGSGDAGSAHAHYAPAASKLGFVCVSPEVLEKTERGWTDSGTEEFVMAAIDAAIRTFQVDPNRVILAGHSMGGYGAWTLGAHHADRCAALAPSAGAPTPILELGTDAVVDLVEGVIPNLRNVRMVVFQSTDDPRVPPEPNQVAFRKIAAARERWGGFDAEYWEVGNRGHDFPEGGVVELLAKVVEAERDPVPERIVWQPDIAWKKQFYWLYWEQPRRHAMVVADLDREQNKISLTCEETIRGLSVLLDERVVDMEREVVIEFNGAEVRREVPVRRLDVLLQTGIHPDRDLMFAARMEVVGGGG